LTRYGAPPTATRCSLRGSPRSCSVSSGGCPPHPPEQAGTFRGYPNARPKSSGWSPPACPISRSRAGSSCPTAPCRTTCRIRSASCSCTTGSNSSGMPSSTAWRASSRRAGPRTYQRQERAVRGDLAWMSFSTIRTTGPSRRGRARGSVPRAGPRPGQAGHRAWRACQAPPGRPGRTGPPVPVPGGRARGRG